MGFDLYGIKAKSKSGEYFRNNVWWWRKLWDFTYAICQDFLTEQDHQEGHMNNGHEINKIKAIAIAERIKSEIADGIAKQFSIDNKATIKRTKENNKTHKAGTPGYDWQEAYPFSIKNLKDFEKFCRNSGGFTIY